MNESDTLESLLGLLKDTAAAGGRWYAVAIAAVVVAIRVYRRPEIQGIIPASYRWNRIAYPWRLVIVFLAAAGASWVAALLVGQGIGSAALASVAVGIAAIGSHKATKAIGHAHTERALERDGALYEPGSIRTVLDPILPIDHKAIRHQIHLAASELSERTRSG